MGLKCQISYSNTGQAIVTDSSGNISQLYTDALALTQNQEAALNIWASAFTPEFEQTFGKVAEGTEPPVLQVIKFYQSLKQLDGRLTTSEVFEAKQMMRSAGIRSLSDLSATLKDIFLYGDIPTVDTQRAIESGLFLPEDLPNIDLPKVVDFITRLEGETLYNDFEVEPENSQIKYRNTANKNVLGASEFVTIEQIDAEIIDLIDDFQSEDEFYGKIQELPYTDFVARFYEDTAFAQDFISRFNGMAKVPVGEEVNGEIIVENVTTTAKTVKNTILDGLDALDINADISFINSIADNVWDSNVEAVTKVIKEIESELATKNIDIVGLHKVTTDKATLVEILDAVATMVANPTVQNIDNFAAIYDKTFLKQPAKKVVKVPTELQGLSLVSLTSPKTDQQLFEEHGLIKVGDNLYHKISLEADISDAYEYLYQQMQDGNFEIPYQYRTETNLDNKTGVLQDIAEYVNGRDTGLGYYNETASLYQLVFNHPKIDTNKMADDTTSALNTIRTDEVYLKTDFVSDFYGMILQEKIKDSALYRNTLSKIGVTDNDLTITSDLIGDLTNIPMYQEFMDYMKLRKSEDMKKYLPSTMYGDTNQALAAYNFPQTIEQYTGPTAEVENVLVTAPTAEDFIRVGENVYQKVKNSETASVFLRLKNNTNPAYYTTQPAFANYTQEQIDRAANTDMVSNSELTATDVANRKEKSGIQSRIVTRIKARNKQVADPANQRNTQAFENNLIEFLRQKGVPVVTDAVAIRTALQQLGIDNVNQMFGFSDMGVQETASITINGNRVTVAPRQGGKVSTQAQAYAISTSIYEKINKYLRENAGDLYRPNMVLRSGNTIITNIPADLASRVQALRELGAEIDSIVAQQRKENAIPEPDRVAEELQRGVSPEVLKDLGYNMLETPAGNILGFEYQGTIYLDPANISNITTLHELIHVFQKMTNIKAEAGDEMAQKVLKKKEDVFGAMAREWEAFHKVAGTEPTGTRTFNALMVGVDGGYNLDSAEGATTIVGLLNVAKKLEKVYGIQPKDWVEAYTAKELATRKQNLKRLLKDKVFDQEVKNYLEKSYNDVVRVRDILLRIKYRTGWSRGTDGEWRYEIDDSQAKVDIEALQRNAGFFGDELALSDVLEHQELFDAYPRLADVEVVVWDDLDLGDAAYSRYDNIIYINVATLPEEQLKAKLLHEVQHAIQASEGFATVGAREIAKMGAASQIPGLSTEGYDNIEEAAFDGVQSIAQLISEGKTLLDISQGDYSNFFFGENPQALVNYFVSKNEYLQDPESFAKFSEEAGASDYVVNFLTDILSEKPAFDLYLNNISEVEARNVEARLKMTPEERRNSLAQDTEDIARDEQVTIENNAGKTVVGNFPLFQVEAYHGSPFEFERFTTERIGTGEGNQAFGWGLYFTDLEGIAKNYADALSKLTFKELFDAVQSAEISELSKNDILDFSEYYNYNYEKTLDKIKSTDNAEAVKFLEDNKNLYTTKTRNLYKVSLHQGKTPDQYNWIMWDKPADKNLLRELVKDIPQTGAELEDFLKGDNYAKVNNIIKNIYESENKTLNIRGRDPIFILPKVVQEMAQKLNPDDLKFLKRYLLAQRINRNYSSSLQENGATINQVIDRITTKILGIDTGRFTGETLYKTLTTFLGSDKNASLFLLENGIDGVKYPAESISRGATSDTARGFNYVVFDENAVTVQERVQFQAVQDMMKTIGLDLSAPVYAQRPGESNEDYHTRLVNEVEAYVTAPEIAEKLENLRQSNPGIWSKIVDFLKNLKEWLASQIGFQDYQGDILEMTKEQYTSALGVSILKDSYDDLFIPQTGKKIANEVMNAAAVLDSQVEIIPLQTDEVQDTLFDKIDNCG